MAAKPVPVRLRPVVIAYIDELNRIGGYGQGRAGVIRRFVENGIAREIRRNVLKQKDAKDLGEKVSEDDDTEGA